MMKHANTPNVYVYLLVMGRMHYVGVRSTDE